MLLEEAKQILSSNGYICEETFVPDEKYMEQLHYLSDAVYGMNQTLVDNDIEESYFDEDNLDLIDNSTVEATFYIKTPSYKSDLQTRIFFKPNTQNVKKIIVDELSFEGTFKEFIKLIENELDAL